MKPDKAIPCTCNMYQVRYTGTPRFNDCWIERKFFDTEHRANGHNVVIVHDPLEYGGFETGTRFGQLDLDYGLHECAFAENTIIRINQAHYRIVTVIGNGGRNYQEAIKIKVHRIKKV